ncbi:MAG: hypothetical protein GWP14_06955 [Actinobacteria bacterium]|nr:hypothetical protein [Actinomycetota bacterium]
MEGTLIIRSSVFICLAVCGLALVVVLFMPGQNGLATITILFSDGLLAAVVLVSAAAAGLNILHCLLRKTSATLDRLTHFVLATALGLGFLSLGTLGLGLAGLLSRGFVIALLLLPIPTGLLILQRLSLQRPPQAPGDVSCRSAAPVRWVWLLAAVPLGLAVLGAALPPGILWPSEARGYDVLEYHLVGPKEYLNAGRIRFLPDNVYTNMPSNVEMLYLLAMAIKSDSSSTSSGPEQVNRPWTPPPYNAVYLINFLNLWIAVLAVLALYRTAGYLYAHRVFSSIIMASCPWLLVVATMDYVEPALLLYTIVAVFVVLAGKRLGLTPVRSAILAGIFVGLACGCKLTAVVLTALPVLILIVLGQIVAGRANIRAILIYSAMAFLVFCPWMVKNVAFTGNPFFPLFYNQLGGPDFSAELAERWNAAHSFDTAPHSYSNRGQALLREFIVHPQFGLAVIVLPIPALFLAWRRRNPHRLSVDLPLVVLFVCQLLAWIGFTYMPSRFFIVALVPLCLLAGRSIILISTGSLRQWLVMLLLILACAAGPFWSVRTFLQAVRSVSPVGLQDRVGIFLGRDLPGVDYLTYVNTILPPKSRILMVGDAASFYWTLPVRYNTVFNINPLAQQARSGSTPRQIINWLVDEGFTHIYVDFSEISRLAGTYGYPPEITPGFFLDLQRAGLVDLRRFGSGPSANTPRAIIYRIVPP